MAHSAVVLPLEQFGPVERKARESIDRYGVTLRSVTAIAAAVFCLLGERVSAWQIPICVAVIGWAIVRLRQRRRTTTPLLLAVDLAMVCFAAVTTPLTTTAGEVINQAGFGISVVNPASLTLVWNPRRWVGALLSATVIGCYFFGTILVTGIESPLALSSVYLLPIQACISRGLVEVFLPASRAADRAAAARLTTAVEIDVTNARRAAEREHWAVLHDTAAATLLMVGEGIPLAANERIRWQAGRDLQTLDRVGQELPNTAVDLIEALRSVLQDAPIRLDLELHGRPNVPHSVGIAAVGALTEVLTNVGRHAQVQVAAVSVRAVDGGFDIEVIDRGRGFDLAQAGRGLGESVIGRMHRVGGVVDISSSAGSGTAVRLGWRPS